VTDLLRRIQRNDCFIVGFNDGLIALDALGEPKTNEFQKRSCPKRPKSFETASFLVILEDVLGFGGIF
jgi:hypothetical protein